MKKLFLTTGLMFSFVGFVQSATVTPKITKINVTPTSAPAGTMFKFTAELSNALPSGYKLKIDTSGKKLYYAMTGTGTSYSLTRTLYTAGTFNYNVVIVNAKNVTQGVAKIARYTVSSAAPANHAPTLNLINAETSATTNTVYTVTLNAKDIDTNLNSITMNWGDNSEPETLTAADSKDLVFSHIYTSASSFGWNAFASDKGTPVLNSKSVSKIVAVSNPAPLVVEVAAPPVVIPVPAKTTGYTKIANNGSELPDSATFGANPTDWACTKDNKTGLIWEVKTSDGGLRDLNNTYSWYEPDVSKNGGNAGTKNGGVCKGSDCDTYSYTNTINIVKLCGAKKWRMPTIFELSNIVYCSDGIYNRMDDDSLLKSGGYGAICTNNQTGLSLNATISLTYFPNTEASPFWSSSFDTTDSYKAWLVTFNFGSGAYFKGGKDGKTTLNVRLVHDAK